MYRYHPVTAKLKELTASKILGDIKLFNATYTANIAQVANVTASGSIRNLGCYPVSLIRLLNEEEPQEIVALGRINASTCNDNQASAIFKFKNNSIACISTADDIEMFWQFEIYGTNGFIKMQTNPWLPTQDNNRIRVMLNKDKAPIEIEVIADKPLYTYQIDAMAHKIFDNVFEKEQASWMDSIGNIKVLETWLSQL